jgi:hypothetical protein
MSQQFKGQYVEVIEVDETDSFHGAWAIRNIHCRTITCYTDTLDRANRAATQFEFAMNHAAKFLNCRYTWE